MDELSSSIFGGLIFCDDLPEEENLIENREQTYKLEIGTQIILYKESPSDLYKEHKLIHVSYDKDMRTLRIWRGGDMIHDEPVVELLRRFRSLANDYIGLFADFEYGYPSEQDHYDALNEWNIWEPDFKAQSAKPYNNLICCEDIY